MISVDVSVFMQIANFLLLIWLMNTVLYRPIRSILIKRSEKIGGLEESISAFQKDKLEKDNAYSEGIKSARTEGMKEKDGLVSSAEEEERAIIAKINAQAQADLSSMRENVAQDAEAVRKALLQDVDTFAMEIGKKILGRAI